MIVVCSAHYTLLRMLHALRPMCVCSCIIVACSSTSPRSTSLSARRGGGKDYTSLTSHSALSLVSTTSSSSPCTLYILGTWKYSMVFCVVDNSPHRDKANASRDWHTCATRQKHTQTGWRENKNVPLTCICLSGALCRDATTSLSTILSSGMFALQLFGTIICTNKNVCI